MTRSKVTQHNLLHIFFSLTSRLKTMAVGPVRLRHPQGVSTIQVDFDTFTVLDLQQEIYALTEIIPSRQECTRPLSLSNPPPLTVFECFASEGWVPTALANDHTRTPTRESRSQSRRAAHRHAETVAEKCRQYPSSSASRCRGDEVEWLASEKCARPRCPSFDEWARLRRNRWRFLGTPGASVYFLRRVRRC